MKPLRFRPSAAHRWLNCAGSVWVANAMPGDSSSYADEGTIAHKLQAHKLDPDTNGSPTIEELAALGKENIALINDGVELVQNIAMLDGYEILVEVEVTAKFGEREVSGTADVVLLNDTGIIIVDLKFGAGRKVRVEFNTQLTIYGLAARYSIPGASKLPITLGILQPRGQGEGLSLWQCPEDYLEQMKKDYAAAIERAYAVALEDPSRPDPAFIQGPWCWGCVGRTGTGKPNSGVCPAVLKSAIMFRCGVELSDAQPIQMPWWTLEHADATAKLCKDIKDLAVVALENKERVPGWSLRWENGRRSWLEPDEVPEILAERTGIPVEKFRKEKKEVKTVGITDALKLCKGVDILDLMKTPSKRVLCREGEDGNEMDEIEE